MKPNLKQRFSNLFKRNWIKKDEGKLTFVQLFGFLLLTLGVIYLSSFLLPFGINKYLPSFKSDDNPTSNGISIAFFTTMLGVAFAFPDLLKGQTKEISTMRIIVFMFANVICMLLLKIGWDKPSLKDIGLDGFWMGVIAFLFGAKATQSYFENAKSFFSESKSNLTAESNTTISKIAIAQIAKVQNEEKLHEKFPNIEFVSDTLKEGESCLTIYVKDNNIKDIPAFVEAQLNENTKLKVSTEVVSNIGKGTPHYGQLTHDIVDSKTPNYFGSICCLVDSVINPNFFGVVTSGHIFTFGNFIDYEGFVRENQATDALSNGSKIGKLYFQQMTPSQDLAIVELIGNTDLQNKFLSFNKGFYKVSISDLNSQEQNVTILSRNNKSRDAYLLDFNVTMRLYYHSAQKIMRNIILIGSSNNKNESRTVSESGDSGSCVIHKESGKLIGMLLGGNDKLSFVLSLEETLKENNFKIK
jgi:hypothetical protein